MEGAQKSDRTRNDVKNTSLSAFVLVFFFISCGSKKWDSTKMNPVMFVMANEVNISPFLHEVVTST